MKCHYRFFLLLFLLLPSLSIQAQLIDNRNLPPENLVKRAPFIPTDRAAVRNKDTGRFFVLDNADHLLIQDNPKDDVVEVTMLGNVRIRFQSSYLRAEKMIITVKEGTAISITASGSVEFTMNDTKYLAQQINYQPKAERGIMYDVRSTLGASFVAASTLPWFYRAEKVTIQSKTRFVLENVTLSTSDARFEHYSIFAKKLWYTQGKMALAFGIQYKVGQAGFIWLPAFVQAEGGGGISTAFGSEKSAGYYFINNFSIDNVKVGKFKFGLDYYERLGQYFTMTYQAPQKGMLQQFDLTVDMANDTRVLKDGVFFSQYLPISPPPGTNTNYQIINQFAWHYKLDTSIATNGISLKIHSELLNDPFFLKKYSSRTYFNNTTSIQFFELINQGYQTFTGNYGGDSSPSLDPLAQTLTIGVGNLSIKTSWNLIYSLNADQRNPFLNSSYEYRLRTMTLPEINYNPGTLELAKYEYKKDILVDIVDSRGQRYTRFINELPALEKALSRQKERVITREKRIDEEGNTVWDAVTNWIPVKITNKTTKPYTLVSINSTASINATFSAEQTFGTNIGKTTDANTNWRIVNDSFKHRETGNINLNASFFNGLISLGNGVDATYSDQWSSFNTDLTNNLKASTFNMDYRVNLGLRTNLTWRDESLTRTTFNFDTSVSYSQPLVRENRFDNLTTKEGNFNWDTKISSEILQWRRIPIFKLNGGIGISERYRFLTEEQRNNLSGDPYLNDKTSSLLRLNGSADIWWLSLGTSANIDMLETKTNINNTFNYTSDPELHIGFKPDSRFHYIPSVTYNYRIQAKQEVSLDVIWALRFTGLQVPGLYPFIYEISEIGFLLNYHHKYENIRDSYLSLNFIFAAKFTKYLTFKYTYSMLNNKLYLYYGRQDLLAPGEAGKNFWIDLGNSLKFWDVSALQSSSFKLQYMLFELIHDLETWDVRLMFRLGQRSDNVRQVVYWEPYIGIAFTMKGSSATQIFPEYNRRFVPPEYQ